MAARSISQTTTARVIAAASILSARDHVAQGAVMHVYLSHPLAPDTPCYRDTREVKVTRTRNLDEGAPVNNHRFELGAHNGTHVDAPLHFVRDGKTVESYAADTWLFNRVALLLIPKDDSELIGQEDLQPFVTPSWDADLVLIKTGFERHRATDPTRY